MTPKVKGHPEVNLLRNVLLIPFIGWEGRKNSSPKCNPFLGSKVMQESIRGQIAQKCPMATKLGGKNP